MPEVDLDRECCDLRNENCTEINAFGNGISENQKIYVKIEIIEVNWLKYKILNLRINKIE